MEERNKQLAKLLEGAFGELMEYHKSVTAFEEKNELRQDHPGAEDLGIAIAKVQFVQVYLDDPKLLLPKETQSADDPLQAAETSQKEKEKSDIQTTVPAESTSPSNATHIAGLADPSAFEDEESDTGASSTQNPQIVVDKGSLEADESTSRPRLDQSSYSWMLGEPQGSGTSFGRSTHSSTERARNNGSLFGGEIETGDTTNDGHLHNDSFDIGKLRRGKG